MNILELSEQEIIRRNSLNELRAMGIDPYTAAERSEERRVGKECRL